MNDRESAPAPGEGGAAPAGRAAPGRQVPRPGDRRETDERFLLLVGALMLVIMALLAGLWLRAHVRATRAELRLKPLVKRNSDLEETLKGLVLSKGFPAKVDRAGLASQPVRIDGRPVGALRLPAGMAESLGFEAGDVIIVEQRTASRPRAKAARGLRRAPATGPREPQEGP